MKRRVQVAVCCGIVAAAMAGGLSADTPPSTYHLPSNSEVIGYLLQSVNWYRHVYTERQVANDPGDLMFLDDNRATERQIVTLSFDFAKADALLLRAPFHHTPELQPLILLLLTLPTSSH